jgi:hypothetical protein
MHADRRYRYVRLRCTVYRARRTKWKTSRDTFNYLVEQHAPNGPVSVRRPKIDGVYSIIHATPCTRQPLALLSDKFWNNGCAPHGAWQSAYVIEHRASISTSTPIADVTLAFLVHLSTRYRFRDSPHFIPSFQRKQGCRCKH